MYDQERAWIDTAVRYLAEGAQGNDQILYVADKPESALVNDLAGLPFRDSMLDSHGQQRGHASLHAGAGGNWRLTGEVEIASLEELELCLSALPTGNDVHLQLDELGFTDVVGTRALINLAERLAPSHRLVVHEPPGVLARISSWRGGRLRASS